jgi:N,N-dimethylformamidase
MAKSVPDRGGRPSYIPRVRTLALLLAVAPLVAAAAPERSAAIRAVSSVMILNETRLGVGPAAQGFARARPYRRTAASYDPRVSWIFDGVDGEEVGANGLGLGGAAGDEMDCVSDLLGTPIDTVLLGSSYDHKPPYRAMQDVVGLAASRCRADMIYLDLPRGGAVFAVGSICWYPSLAYNNYDNDVARVTRNVVTRFLRPRTVQ